MNTLEHAAPVCSPIDLGELSRLLHLIDRDPGLFSAFAPGAGSTPSHAGGLWLQTDGVDAGIAEWILDSNGLLPNRPCDAVAMHAQPCPLKPRHEDELLPLGLHFRDASLTLSRNGAARPEDQFMADPDGPLASLAEGQPIVVDGRDIGLVTRNSGGVCRLLFNARCSMDCLDTLMDQLVCRSPVPTGPETDQATNWTFCCFYMGSQETDEEHIFVGCTPGASVQHHVELDIDLS